MQWDLVGVLLFAGVFLYFILSWMLLADELYELDEKYMRGEISRYEWHIETGRLMGYWNKHPCEKEGCK